MSKGDIIKTLITESGIPITEIARRINVDRRTIYSYMKRDDWKPETLKQLSIACNKEANYLLKKILESEESELNEMTLEDSRSKYGNASLKEIKKIKAENARLLNKLVELQEKHILLHEELQQLKKQKVNK